ncbi:3-deoxy-D-manno-octulosonic acid transferase, partial [Vibrio parahaemolyticus]
AADICFMGGRLIGDKVGGHNVLEPAALGVPVITGPSYYNFTEIVNLLKKHSFCNIITKINELSNLIDNHFSLSTNSKSLHSANFIANYTNVVNKIVTIIFEQK